MFDLGNFIATIKQEKKERVVNFYEFCISQGLKENEGTVSISHNQVTFLISKASILVEYSEDGYQQVGKLDDELRRKPDIFEAEKEVLLPLIKKFNKNESLDFKKIERKKLELVALSQKLVENISQWKTGVLAIFEMVKDQDCESVLYLKLFKGVMQSETVLLSEKTSEEINPVMYLSELVEGIKPEGGLVSWDGYAKTYQKIESLEKELVGFSFLHQDAFKNLYIAMGQFVKEELEKAIQNQEKDVVSFINQVSLKKLNYAVEDQVKSLCEKPSDAGFSILQALMKNDGFKDIEENNTRFFEIAMSHQHSEAMEFMARRNVAVLFKATKAYPRSFFYTLLTESHKGRGALFIDEVLSESEKMGAKLYHCLGSMLAKPHLLLAMLGHELKSVDSLIGFFYQQFSFLKIEGFYGILKNIDIVEAMMACEKEIMNHYQRTKPLGKSIYLSFLKDRLQELSASFIVCTTTLNTGNEKAPWVLRSFVAAKMLAGFSSRCVAQPKQEKRIKREASEYLQGVFK